MIKDNIDRIVFHHMQIEEFWNHGAYGWSPKDASDLLAKSRLDRQTSLAHCLHKWTGIPNDDEADGTLILAWANLGALVEGTMKWFLCVYYHNYQDDPILIKKSKIEPDEAFFKTMADFYYQHIWTKNEKERWNLFVELVRQRRNAIHSFNDKPIGDFEEFYYAVKEYEEFLDELDGRVPYP